MNKKLILCAPIAMVLASCSTTRMGHVVPESRDTEFQDLAIQGWNTGSVITYGKNQKTGYMETANVTVYQDSGIDQASKLANAVGSVALGTGSVMEGMGTLRYADAMQDYASAYKKLAHDGWKYEVTGDLGTSVSTSVVNNVTSDSSSGSSSGSSSIAESSAGASADASAGASAGATAINDGGKPHGGGHDKPHGGYDKPHGGFDKPHGGYDKPHGGFDKPHGGYEKNY